VTARPLPVSARGRLARWALAFALAAGSFAWVAIPAVLIRPFVPQTPFGVALSYEMRRQAPLVTALAIVLLLALLLPLARRSRAWPRLAAALLVVVAGASAWFARQNHFEWMFNPLSRPAYAPAALVDFVDGRDMVVTVEIAGDAVAWPVLQMAYHHLLNDTVGGVAVVTTY